MSDIHMIKRIDNEHVLAAFHYPVNPNSASGGMALSFKDIMLAEHPPKLIEPNIYLAPSHKDEILNGDIIERVVKLKHAPRLNRNDLVLFLKKVYKDIEEEINRYYEFNYKYYNVLIDMY